MSKKYYHDWDWEFDHGVSPIVENDVIPSQYAVAYYDDYGRLFRVEACRSLPYIGETGGEGFTVLQVYDYFCDRQGRILQKRSRGSHVDETVIVDFSYDDSTGEVRQSAWSIEGGRSKWDLRRPISNE